MKKGIYKRLINNKWMNKWVNKIRQNKIARKQKVHVRYKNTEDTKDKQLATITLHWRLHLPAFAADRKRLYILRITKEQLKNMFRLQRDNFFLLNQDI